MAAERRKEAPSFPPDYVSLAQLKKLWLQKQEEKKLKQIQEEEEKNKVATCPIDDQNQGGLESDGQGKMFAGSPINVTEEMKEKGKGKVIDGFENAEEEEMKKKKRRKKKKNREQRERRIKKHLRETKSATVEECGDASEKGKTGESGCEDIETNRCYMVKEGVSRALSGKRSKKEFFGEWKGTGEAESVAVIEVSPVDAENEKLPRVEQNVLRGGRGMTRGSRHRSKQKYRFELDRVKETEARSSAEVEEDEKVHVNMWRRKGNGHTGDKSYRVRASGSDVLEAKEVEMKSEKKTTDELSVVVSGIQRLNTKDKERISWQRRDGRNSTEGVDRAGQNGENVSLENKVEDVLSGIKSVKLHAKRKDGNCDGRYRNSSEYNDGKFGISTLMDKKAGNMRSRAEKNDGYHQNTYANSGRSGGNRNRKHRESSLVWLKKGEKLSANAAAAAPLEFQQITGDQTDEKHFSGGYNVCE